MVFILFVLGLAALIYGAHLIVKEAERIALHFDIAPFIIGATLIAVGTSLPEMGASMTASYQDKSALAISNVLGSVIFNITLVLGIIFLWAKKIRPTRDIFAKDSEWALFPLIIFLLMIFDHTISRFEGALFLLLMLGYILFLLSDAKDLLEIDASLHKMPFKAFGAFGLLCIGFVLVLVGAHYAIESATSLARLLGVSEWIVGILLVSLGTSLPELVVSVVAIKKGQVDMSIGNIIGSNIANFTMVLGSAALVAPLHIQTSLYVFDIAMAAVATFVLVFITANKLYNKSAGIVLMILLALFIQNALQDLTF